MAPSLLLRRLLLLLLLLTKYTPAHAATARLRNNLRTPAGKALSDDADDFLSRDLSHLGPIFTADEAAAFDARVQLMRTDPAAWRKAVFLETGAGQQQAGAYGYIGNLLCDRTYSLYAKVIRARRAYENIGRQIRTLQQGDVKRCKDRQEWAREQCRCTQTACSAVAEDTCGREIQQKTEELKKYRKAAKDVVLRAQNTYKRDGQTPCKMKIRFVEWGIDAWKSVKDAVAAIVKAAACLVVQTLLASVGEAVDVKLQLWFPLIKTMQSTPMCRDGIAKTAKNKALGHSASSPLKTLQTKTVANGKFRAARLHDIADEMGALFKDMLSGSVAVGDPYVPFSWSIFRFVAKAVDNTHLNSMIENAVETTIEFIVNVVKNALCGRLGSALMMLLSELLFCNFLCLDVCATGDAFKIDKLDPAGSVAGSKMATLPAPKGARCTTVPGTHTHTGWRHKIFHADSPVTAAQVCDDPLCDAEVYDGHIVATTPTATQAYESALQTIPRGGEGGASHCDDERGCLTGDPACQQTDAVDARFVGCYRTDLDAWQRQHPSKLIQATGTSLLQHKTPEDRVSTCARACKSAGQQHGIMAMQDDDCYCLAYKRFGAAGSRSSEDLAPLTTGRQAPKLQPTDCPSTFAEPKLRPSWLRLRRSILTMYRIADQQCLLGSAAQARKWCTAWPQCSGVVCAPTTAGTQTQQCMARSGISARSHPQWSGHKRVKKPVKKLLPGDLCPATHPKPEQHSGTLNHGDVCRRSWHGDPNHTPQFGDWSCPAGCSFTRAAPWCTADGGGNAPCRALPICPDAAFPNLRVYNAADHGDVCRPPQGSALGDWGCPAGCNKKLGAPWCTGLDGVAPCRIVSTMGLPAGMFFPPP